MTTRYITGPTGAVIVSNGQYDDPVTITSTGTVYGSDYGILANTAWSIVNQGSIGGGTYGVTLSAGGEVSNASTGTITSGRYGVFVQNAAGTVQNAGYIGGREKYGVYLGAGGEVSNVTTETVTDTITGEVTGTIIGTIIGGVFGVYVQNAAGTVDNAGFISGGRYGVYLGAGGEVSNAATGTITGVSVADAGTVENAGSIGLEGAHLLGGGVVSNASTGTITGGVGLANAAGTVENAGYITASDDAVVATDGGEVSNAATGTITGRDFGVYLLNIPGTVDNAGTILGNSAGVGLNLGVRTGGTVENTGSIHGNRFGVELIGGGEVSNSVTGTIYGGDSGYHGNIGVQMSGAAATLENAGTITGEGGTAVSFAYAGDRLIVDAGAVFNGSVVAGGSGDTIELSGKYGAGTLSGLGSEYQGFQTVTIDASATWDIAGTVAAFNGVTIDDFNSHDRLDLTDLTFNAGDTATVNSSNQLVVDDPNGNITIQMDGSVSGDFFTLLNDGSGDTFVEETTPCYCRGTRIRTPNGDVAVEALRIGDRVTTGDGTVLPIKWIGRRSYRDWLAVGNPDVQPILFKAGSIADHVPASDLYVSPEHAMLLDGMLIPARHLVNGVSILKVEGMEEIDYFHLEFDHHVVIYAEGAAAESFVDDDSRMLFHNADEYRRLYPDETRGRFTEFCAPRVEDGYELETIHRQLMIRAARLLPDGTAAEAPARLGYLDRVTRTAVEGWAFAGMGEGPVKLAILVNGAVIGQTVADRYRAGLGFGDGHCSFRFALPLGLSTDVGHRIEVRRESDWSPLPRGRVSFAATPRAHTPFADDGAN